MITMPRRSVTRFFIPLIDVLLLLFCIFLLMPIVGEEPGQGATPIATPKQSIDELVQTLESIEQELQRRTKELQKLEELRLPLLDLEKVRRELDRLRKEKILNLQDRLAVRVVDMDAKTGDIAWFDPSRPDEPLAKITTAKEAQGLIERHRKELGERELFYYFLFPRAETGYPTQAQTRRYKEWFADVANSLKEEAP
jgi:DNA repair exonuclease SbcCD ATPase subunit